MSKEQYCPIIDICNKYPKCSMFSDHKWLKCLVYQKIRSWVYEKSVLSIDDTSDSEGEVEDYGDLYDLEVKSD